MNGVAPGHARRHPRPRDGAWIAGGRAPARQERIGDRVDIGVEYVGKEPRGVVTMAIGDGGSNAGERRERATPGAFAVLYLPESGRQPTLPFKTLIMATCEFEPQSLPDAAVGGGPTTRCA